MVSIFELVPNQQEVSQPLFPSAEAQRAFCESFSDSVRPELERLEEARRKSEQESRQRLLR
jgi:hypothetical protein